MYTSFPPPNHIPLPYTSSSLSRPAWEKAGTDKGLSHSCGNKDNVLNSLGRERFVCLD